jgi:hypothetical protein
MKRLARADWEAAMQAGYKGTLLAIAVVLACGCAGDADRSEADRETDVYPRFEEDYGADRDGLNLGDDADVDNLEIGWGIDAQGMVSDDMKDDRFGASDTIHLSMKVDEAAPGSMVRLVVFDEATDQEVMSTEKNVVAEDAYLNFTIDKGKLASGDYRAEVMIGTDTVAEEEFEITNENVTRTPRS